MLAARLPGLLPDLDEHVALEVTAVHSLVGHLPAAAADHPPSVRRPAPHGVPSPPSSAAGAACHARVPSQLAHGGVLFLDDASRNSKHHRVILFQRDARRLLSMGRVLAVVRLSRDTDDSTSVVRQRAEIERWTDSNGHEVVGWAEDVDVSGSVPPWQRPNLGKWLPDPATGKGGRPDDFDLIVSWRLDRLGRRVLRASAGLIESVPNSRAVRIVLYVPRASTRSARRAACSSTILGALAEGELDAIPGESQGVYGALLESGRWRGGWCRPISPGEAGRGLGLVVEPEAGGQPAGHRRACDR